MAESALHGPVEVCLFWLLSFMHFLHSGVVNLKNLFLRLSVLWAYTVVFSVSFFRIVSVSFLFRIKFYHFSVSDRTITCASENFLSYFLRLFPLLSHAFVQNFSEFVQNKIFFVQKPEEIPACFFRIFGIFLCGLRIFCFLFLTFPVEKSVFFFTRPSVNDRIYSYRPYIFHTFFGWFDKFFSFFSRVFLHFPFRLRKNLLFFPCETEKFFCPFRYFLRFSWIFSKEKSALFSMNFPCGWTIFPFLVESFQIFPIPSGNDFHAFGIFFYLSGSFSYGPDARAPARA